jgi:hypothetical protein
MRPCDGPENAPRPNRVLTEQRLSVDPAEFIFKPFRARRRIGRIDRSKFMSWQVATTRSSRPAFLNACTRQPAPEPVKTK